MTRIILFIDLFARLTDDNAGKLMNHLTNLLTCVHVYLSTYQISFPFACVLTMLYCRPKSAHTHYFPFSPAWDEHAVSERLVSRWAILCSQRNRSECAQASFDSLMPYQIAGDQVLPGT